MLQILWTSILGWGMILAHQPWGGSLVRLRSRHVTIAHVDWIMLALLQIAAAYILSLRQVPDAYLMAQLISFSGWVAPLTYIAQAWGINGFRLDGRRLVDTVVGLLGFASTSSFTYAWVKIVMAWF